MGLRTVKPAAAALAAAVLLEPYRPLREFPVRYFGSTGLLLSKSACRCSSSDLKISNVMNVPRGPLSSVPNPKASATCNTTPSAVLSDVEGAASLIPNSIDLYDPSKFAVKLYQFQSCPFCNKVRACLDYLQVPYQVVEVHPLFKRELEWSADYKKVPILRVESPNQPTKTEPLLVLTDSKRIVHALLSRCQPQRSDIQESKERSESAIQDAESNTVMIEWIKWSDNVLVQLIVLNIYRSYSEASETFNYLLTYPGFSTFQKYSGHIAGSLVMWLVSRRRKAKFQINDERQSLYDAVNDFIDAKGLNKFHGGQRPNEADLNVFGILRSIQGFSCDKDLRANTRVSQWLDDMFSLTRSTATEGL